MDKKVCFLTTVFPMPDEYLRIFFTSLNEQTVSNFDLIIVNDGNANLVKHLKSLSNLNAFIIDSNGSDPIENRKLLIEHAVKESYDIAIFGDSDDYFSKNRVENTLEHFSNLDVDILVNELGMFFDGKVDNVNLLSPRFENIQKIPMAEIIDKNFIGLTNSAVNLKAVNLLDFIKDGKEVIALDWYIFTRAMLKGAQVYFTNECVSHYRQYSNNTASLVELNMDSIKKVYEVKFRHYTMLKKYGDIFSKRIEKVERAKSQLRAIDTGFEYSTNKEITIPSLWWELPIIEEIINEVN